MNRFVRIVAVVLLAGSAFPAGPDARAADATLRVDKQGWFWRHAVVVNVDPLQTIKDATQVEVPCPLPEPVPPIPCPSVQQRPNPFEDDHLLVGRFSDLPEAERDQAMALLLFDLTWMDLGTTVLDAKLQLEESNDDLTGAPGSNNPTNLGQGHPNRRPSGNVDPASARIVACPVFTFWGGSQPTIPALWNERPQPSCDRARVAGKREIVTRDGRSVPIWTFDITPIAKLWADDPFAAQGLAIVPAEGAAGRFMVSFHGNTYVIQRDLVTQQDLATTLVERVVATMRFVPPPEIDLGGDVSTGPFSDVDAAATDVLGASFEPATDPGPGVSPVNRFIGVVHGPQSDTVPFVRTGSESTAELPAYVWLPVLGAVLGFRLFGLLFLGDPRRREHRVAAVAQRVRRGGVA